MGTPVIAGRFHCYGGHSTLFEPRCQCVQVSGVCAEAPDRGRGAIRRHGHVMFAGSDIDRRGIELTRSKPTGRLDTLVLRLVLADISYFLC